MSSDKVLGIDLGTTNSAFALMEGGGPEIIVNSEGERTTPSVVAMTEADELLVGKQAKNQMIQNPTQTVSSIKRHMGGDDYVVNLGDDDYSPEQISAFILQKIKRDAEEYLGEEITRAVITVPAYFNDQQREATKNAGEIAGFEVERIINEPTAAAMSYNLDDDRDQTVLVYDLGGGTFDVSILNLGDGVYEVLATNGDNELGGDDWDETLVDWMADQFTDEHDIDLRNEPQSHQRLRDAAEDAKIELSTRKETSIHLPFIGATETGPVHFEADLTRATFESLTEELIKRTVEPTKQALADAEIDAEDIEEVILVGGSSRMPMVQEQVEDLLGQDPRGNVNPDEAVALGAAVQAGILGGEIDDIVLLDVTPLSLGVEIKGGLFERLIKKNTTIPVEESKTFTTAVDNQSQVQIRVLQGEREIAEENHLLGEFQLTGIPPAPAGVPMVTVKFNIDADGIVNVTAEEKGRGNSESITIEGGVGLGSEDIEQMKQEAEDFADEDKERRERVEARNEADKAANRAETLIAENRETVEDADVEPVEDALEETLAVINTSDVSSEELKSATRELNNVMQDLGRKLY
jgi:molecular chaperone DnaK